MERLLAATVEAALTAGAVKLSGLERVTLDTTMRPRAIAFPLGSRLYHRGREIRARRRQTPHLTAAELPPSGEASLRPGQSLCTRAAHAGRTVRASSC